MFDDPVKANSNFPLIASNDIHGKKKHACRVGFKLRNVSAFLPAGAISDDYNFIALSFCPSQIPRSAILGVVR